MEIIIADSGHGISPEDKERLFLPHFSTKERGTGLGLAIASRIIAEHNGTIRVEDNLPTGTTFVIRFPAAEATVAPAPAGHRHLREFSWPLDSPTSSTESTTAFAQLFSRRTSEADHAGIDTYS